VKNIHAKAVNSARRKQTTVFNSCIFAGTPFGEESKWRRPSAAKISVKTARETIKTTSGNKKATITFSATEGHEE
jgi:hypothetical protein